MIRLAELVLFLSPFAAYAVWWWLGRVAPSPAVLAVTFMFLAAFGAALAWFGVDRRLAPGAYVPARLVDGRIIPGHAAP
ncbi:MAG: hypothetical protein JO209_07010 [Acidisphaera sp.]|nr:hypothetical protein [Acidisphaera sp.]